MEFVIVTCQDKRKRVFIDNQKQGVTGQRHSVEQGFHVFDLGAVVDYQPDTQEVEVTGTSKDAPMTIEFVPIAGARVRAVGRPRPAKRAQKRSTRTAARRAPNKAKAGRASGPKSKGRKRGATSRKQMARRRSSAARSGTTERGQTSKRKKR
jgi:hypothetical protein